MKTLKYQNVFRVLSRALSPMSRDIKGAAENSTIPIHSISNVTGASWIRTNGRLLGLRDISNVQLMSLVSERVCKVKPLQVDKSAYMQSPDILDFGSDPNCNLICHVSWGKDIVGTVTESGTSTARRTG